MKIERIESLVKERFGTKALRPGITYTAFGTGFGLFDASCNVELSGIIRTDREKSYSFGATILEWSSGGAVNTCSFFIPDVPGLLPIMGAITFKNARGDMDLLGCFFKPFYDLFHATMTIPFGGGLFGISEEHVVLKGIDLPTPTIYESVNILVDGGGHAELHEPTPFAGGYYEWLGEPAVCLLDTGFHIGLPALQGTLVTLEYIVSHPRGFGIPDQVAGLTPWKRIGRSSE